MSDLKRILYGEFFNGFHKRIIIVLIIAIALLNYLNFKYTTLLNFLSFNKTYWILNIGFVWMILSIWVLIWFTDKRRGF